MKKVLTNASRYPYNLCCMTCLTRANAKKALKRATPLLVFSYFLLMAIFVNNSTAKAAKLSDGTWTNDGSPGSTTVAYTNTTFLPASSDVVLTFPATASVDQDGTGITITGQTSPTRTNNTVDNTITITIDGTLSASLAVTIVMENALTSYTTTTYAQESLAINTQDNLDAPVDFGVAIVTNDNTTTVTASVPLFVTMAVDDTSIELGTLSTGSVSSATQQYTVNSNNTSGITMQIAHDGDIDDGSGNDIDAVSDGTVTAGSEEYGIEVTTSGLTVDATYISGDNEIVQSADDLASSAAAVAAATLDITYKASITGTTVAGSYDQVVTVTISTNA